MRPTLFFCLYTTVLTPVDKVLGLVPHRVIPIQHVILVVEITAVTQRVVLVHMALVVVAEDVPIHVKLIAVVAELIAQLLATIVVPDTV